jgi:hypothetical protein
MAVFQENLPLAFLLIGGGIPMTVIFDSQFGAIKPENLRYTRPARRVVYNTASRDTAFLDDWGEGIGRLSIAGHTGWTPGSAGAGSSVFSGLALFKTLETMITQFWNQRQALTAAGQNPNTVHLLFFDTNNVEVLDCYPDTFTLSRSNQRPQLYMYRMEFTILLDLFDAALAGLGSDFLKAFAGAGSISAASAALTQLGNYVITAESLLFGLSGLSGLV